MPKLMFTNGKNIDYLGIIFKFFVNDTVIISMKSMVCDLVDMGIKTDQVSTIPATSHPFEVDDTEKSQEKHLRNTIIQK